MYIYNFFIISFIYLINSIFNSSFCSAISIVVLINPNFSPTAYDFEGTRYDVGEKFGFIKTTIEMALQNEELKIEFPHQHLSVDFQET
jgi:UTP-glucose-1-phosphate uridylyltransferase